MSDVLFSKPASPDGPFLPLDDPSVLLSGGLSTDPSPSLDSILTQGLQPAIQQNFPVKSSPGFTLFDATGNSVQVGPNTTSIPLGSQTLTLADGSQGVFSPGFLSAGITSQQQSTLYDNADEVRNSYSGSDLRIIMDVYDPTGSGDKRTKQLVEFSTISISIHRVKSPVRACGFINPRGFARGGRTIAGTIVLTQFTVDLMYRFLYTLHSNDLSKDTLYVKPDQLPPFDLTLMFGDEYGNASYRRLLGIECMTDGSVYSINDMYSEQTISYMAADFTPLMPLTKSTILDAQISSVTAGQKTPLNVLVNETPKSPLSPLLSTPGPFSPSSLARVL